MRWDIAWKYIFTLRVWSTFSHANVLLKCSIYGMRVQSFNSGRRRYNQSVFGFHMTNSNILPQLYWGRFKLKWLTVIQFYLNPDLWLCLMVSVDFHLNFVLRCFNIYNVWIHIFTWFKGVNGETQSENDSMISHMWLWFYLMFAFYEKHYFKLLLFICHFWNYVYFQMQKLLEWQWIY